MIILKDYFSSSFYVMKIEALVTHRFHDKYLMGMRNHFHYENVLITIQFAQNNHVFDDLHYLKQCSK